MPILSQKKPIVILLSARVPVRSVFVPCKFLPPCNLIIVQIISLIFPDLYKPLGTLL